MTQLVRVPLAWPIGTRSGSSLTKDPYIKNGVLEKYGDKMMIAKRPGTALFETLGGAGPSQGATFFNGNFYGIALDALDRDGGVPASSTGVAWTNAGTLTSVTTPPWAATTHEGAAFFLNRMWVLGGFASEAGIWSTSDGITWTVNAGGQPWGLRDGMSVVVANDNMYVLGGLNLTLGTVFNDVWASNDGTNWTDISVAGITPWAARSEQGAVATPNGIYLMGGYDFSGPTYFNDVWYSPSGISTDASNTTWAQLTAAAPWSAREGFSCLWWRDRIWVIGGRDSSGTALNDVWSSADGITWDQATPAAFATGRFYCYACVYLDQMWIIGGDDGTNALTDVYSTQTGTTWTLQTVAPGWSAREGGKAVVFRTPDAVSSVHYETMWLLGGDDGTGTMSFKEVWYGNIDGPVFTSMGLATSVSGQQYQFNTFLNNTQLLFKNQTDFFVFSGYTPVRVTDTNYPETTVPGIVTLNGRVYVMTPRGEIHSCSLENPLVWPTLDFVTADYEDDAGVALAKYLNYVVAFGTWTTQFFYDNGANQPVGSVLAPYINANLRVGCVAAQSVATCGNGLYWVGQGDQGARSIYTLNGLTPQVISSPYIDRILMAASTTYMQGLPAVCDGREFYIVKTGIDTAIVYDITYKEWYEWDTFPYLDYVTNFTTQGDYLYTVSGNQLVQFLPTAYTDAVGGNFTLKVQCDKEDHGTTARKFWGSAVLVGDIVPGATPSIGATDDDYNTTTTFGTVSMNTIRPRITRLGSARRRSWVVSQTDALRARWEALEVEYSQGQS